MPDKVEFASEAWIEAAKEILADLAATRGAEGDRFSVCECFTSAPAEIASDGLAAWHFRIDGQTATAGAGAIKDADVVIEADYQATLPTARLVYTPEYLAERARRRASGEAPAPSGDWSRAPSYLVELHNRLAVITA